MKRPKPKTLKEIMQRMSDDDLSSLLPWIRNENGEKPTLAELKDYLHGKKDGPKGGM